MLFQPTDKLVESVVYHCQTRHPEALDEIFDNLPLHSNEHILAEALAVLHNDLDSMGWLCGYLASEINSSDDNNRYHPITELCKALLEYGMELFVDFTPYPGSRILIANIEKFKSLPEFVRDAYQVMESTGDNVQQMNNALLQELVI
jgi:hypothetical protein